MNDDLLKSVREVIGCAYHRHRCALRGADDCDDCLRLVLAHCGERAVHAGMKVHAQDDHWAKLWVKAIQRTFETVER